MLFGYSTTSSISDPGIFRGKRRNKTEKVKFGMSGGA